MNVIINKSNLLAHGIGLTMVLMALSDLMHSRNVILGASLLSISVFALHFPFENRKHLLEATAFSFFILIMSFINLFFTKNNFGGSITILGSLVLSFLYLKTDTKKLTFWVFVIYTITIGFIAYHLFILQTPANDIYEGSSRNHAGAAVVFYTTFLLFHLKTVYNIFPLIPPLFGLVLSFLLFGRTSIAVSAALLMIVFFFKFRRRILVQALMLIFLCALCYFLWVKFGNLLTTETNFGEGLDTPRWELWSIYIDHLNYINFFTGIDVSTLPLYDQFQGNPHNSFLKFHSRVGLGSILLIILFGISIFQYSYQRNFYILLLLSLIAIRAFFDSDILIGNFDFIFFIITFYWIKFQK